MGTRWNAFFEVKSPSTLQQQADEGGAPPRALGLRDLLLMGVGGVVGTGVFVLTGKAAWHAGPAVSLSFAISGLAAGLAGLCYAEFAAMVPVAGSAYTYTYATLGRGLAFLMGWDLILEYGLAASTVATGWSGYLQALSQHLLGIGLPAALCAAPFELSPAGHGLVRTGAFCNLPAMGILMALTAVLRHGLKVSVRLIQYVVGIKFLVIGGFVVLAAPHVQRAHLQPFVPENLGPFGQLGMSGVLQAASMLFLTYAGFDVISTAAQEARRPQRDLPLAMLGSLGIAASIYVLVAIVLTGVVPYTELNVADPLSVGLRAVGHPGGRLIVEAGALAGLTSVLLLQLFGQTRILLAMARDGLLPASLTALHPVHQTPVRLTYWVGGLAALAAGCLPLDLLGELSSVGTLLAFMGVAGAVVQMRRQRPDWPRPFRIPGGNFLLPGFSLGISGLLLCTATAGSQWRLAAWLGLGLLIYARQASCGARPDPRASVNS